MRMASAILFWTLKILKVTAVLSICGSCSREYKSTGALMAWRLSSQKVETLLVSRNCSEKFFLSSGVSEYGSETSQFLQSGSFLTTSAVRKPKCSAVLVAILRNSVGEYFIRSK